MSWITFVPFEEATGKLKKLYDKYKRPNNTIANILSAHSLRPHTLEGHMTLYRSVIGHSANQLPLWFLEAVGVYVSLLNKCDYCLEHHSHLGGLAYDGPAESWQLMIKALAEDSPEDFFDGKFLALLRYAKSVATTPALITAQSIEELREMGADDGEVLEVNQVAAYFSYANRTVLGLGISLANEVRTVR
jgi:uncharacterized peroxidase-related enzyme